MALTKEQLPQLERMCEELYTSSNADERKQAEHMLKVFSTNPEYATQCQMILQNSTSPYAQLLASSSLVRLVTDHFLPANVKTDIRGYVTNYLASHGASLMPFVVTSLVQLLCRVVKLGWFENEGHRECPQDVRKFLEQESPVHVYLGLRILCQLVAEMNTPCPGRSLTQHRKTAVSFRDTALCDIFTWAISCLASVTGAALPSAIASANANASENGGTGGRPSTPPGGVSPPSPAGNAAHAPRPNQPPLRPQARSQDEKEKMLDQTLNLALKCLSYDFVGTCLDESSEDLGTIQVPTSWRPYLEDPQTMVLFIDTYAATQPPLSNCALECLVRIASVRRSLFSGEAERTKFLSRLLMGTRDILRNQTGLAEHENYHEFCRLLGRLKTNYQLSELVGLDSYAEWISRVHEFTISSLVGWRWAQGSIFYLLGLWSRLVSSAPYLKSTSPSLLENYVPLIYQAYVTSRVESVQAVYDGSVGEDEDLLEIEDSLSDQMEALPYLCRFKYEQSAEFLCSMMDPTMAEYFNAVKSLKKAMEASASGISTPPAGLLDANALKAIDLLEGRLTWFVHIISAVVRGRLSSGGSSATAEMQETVDGDLSARCFRILNLVDSTTPDHGEAAAAAAAAAAIGSPQAASAAATASAAAAAAERAASGPYSRVYNKSRQRLELALLSFFQSFRKVYIGESAMHSSRVYMRLNERLGLHDHLVVLGVMVRKVYFNLRVYRTHAEIIDQTLKLFQDLASGYMSGKQLHRLDAVHYVLCSHTESSFPFLRERGNLRSRTTFYHTLGRLLFMDDATSRFRAFVLPIHNTLCELASVPDVTLRDTTECRRRMIGLSRDLRGLAQATSSRKTYTMVYEWLYPKHTQLFLRALSIWTADTDVAHPILKLFNELALNKTQRITFDASSPGGILLFREISKVVCLYGEYVCQEAVVNAAAQAASAQANAGADIPPAPGTPEPGGGPSGGGGSSRGDVYTLRYKGIWISLMMLTRCLGGGYVNFGVFDLYGDPSLNDAIRWALRMCLSIPVGDLHGYKKLSRAHYSLLEQLCHSHPSSIINTDVETFSHLFRSLEMGLRSLEVSISSQCASALDSLAAFCFNANSSMVQSQQAAAAAAQQAAAIAQANAGSAEAAAAAAAAANGSLGIGMPSARDAEAAQLMAKHLRMNPQLVHDALKALYEIVLFEECSNQWSLSRPMLSLALLDVEAFERVQHELVSQGQGTANNPERAQRLRTCFTRLMHDVSPSLEPKNRDRFTQNLTVVRLDFQSRT